MKYKSVNLVILAIAMILCLGLVSAVTIHLPADGATLTGIIAVNVTNSSLPQIINCSVYMKSASTANSSWTLMALLVNRTFNPVNVNGTFNTSYLEDANDYIMNASCRNVSYDSSIASEDLATGLIVQNTAPTTPSSLSPASASIDEDGLVTFSANLTDSRTTGCTLYFVGKNPGSSSYSMTHTSGTSTCTSSQLTLPEQSYIYYITATDGTNTNSSEQTTFRVDTESSAGKTVALATQRGVTSTGGATLSVVTERYIPGTGIPIWFIFVLVGIIALIVVVYKLS